jgi:hypothetical protein
LPGGARNVLKMLCILGLLVGGSTGAALSAYSRDPALAGIIHASGILGMFVGGAKFAPVVRTYTTGTAATETIPPGCSSVTIEVWGGSASGGTANGGSQGGGGASGSYTRTVVSLIGHTGATFTYTVGPGGAGSTGTNVAGHAGTASSVSGALITSMNAPAGNGGQGGGTGTGGTPGGVGTGGNAANTNGNSGVNSGTGGAGIIGVNGTGNSGSQGSNTTTSLNGGTGMIIFAYS